MSKRLKNYPDPVEVVNKFGADALRWVGLISFLQIQYLLMMLYIQIVPDQFTSGKGRSSKVSGEWCP